MYRKIKPTTSSSTADTLVLLLPAQTRPASATGCPDPQALSTLLRASDTTLAPEQAHTLIHAKGKPARTLVIGLGEKNKITAQTLRLAAAKALRLLDAAKASSASIQTLGLPRKLDSDTVGRAIADGVSLANFTFNT